MTQATEHKVRREGWPAGPWDDEPDKVQFIHADLDCLLVRNHSGGWCGYVGVPEGHPWFKVNDKLIEPVPPVHGGLTYSAFCGGAICHVPEPGRTDRVWWVGFDCMHAGDYAPSLNTHRAPGDRLPREWEEYRDMAYVRAQTEQLAEFARTVPRTP